MRKIFLDIGGWNGASAIFFRKYHPQGLEFEIFTFEPDHKNIQVIKSKKLPITLIEKAAWSSNGKIKFYPGGAMPGSGGTLYSQKTTGNINPKNFYEVHSIDIGEFIQTNFNKSDYIILKMNCEGAEYEIIPHMKRNGLIDWIDKWYVQWHWEKLKMFKEQHALIISMLPEWHPWDCQCHELTFKDKFIKSL
jgi:FkbM family methyltransferase